jgi:N-acetylglucosaminyldiphosphoundecaprenol N-acetyl-beta-D-mannosaminyltransferase
VLGFNLDLLDLEEAAQWVCRRAAWHEERGSKTTSLVFSFNPELVLKARRDPRVAEALLGADICLADGVGAVWAANRQGARGVISGGGESGLQRVAGIDLAGRVLEIAAQTGLAVYMLGGAPGVAEMAAMAQAERTPELVVAGCADGYFPLGDEAEVVARIRQSGAKVLLVGMGAPKQELFLYRNRERLEVPVALGIGGTLDVWSGRVKRAPGWVREAKAEWLYRLAKEPSRARRQAALPAFAAQILLWEPDDYGPGRRGKARKKSERVE